MRKYYAVFRIDEKGILSRLTQEFVSEGDALAFIDYSIYPEIGNYVILPVYEKI